MFLCDGALKGFDVQVIRPIDSSTLLICIPFLDIEDAEDAEDAYDKITKPGHGKPTGNARRKE